MGARRGGGRLTPVVLLARSPGRLTPLEVLAARVVFTAIGVTVAYGVARLIRPEVALAPATT